MKITRKCGLAVLTAMAALCSPLSAGPIYTVTLDTTPLPAGNYFLDYQLAGTATPLGANTVNISNLSLGGGSFLSQQFSNGGSGAFPNYSLTDTKVFNEDLIGFSRGSSVQYNLSFTNNFAGAGTPDTFSFAVLDKNLNSIVSAGLQASLAVNLNGGTAPIQAFPAQAVFNSTTPVVTLAGAAVPEPGTLALVFFSVAVVLLVLRRKAA